MMPMVSMPSTAPSFGIASCTGTPWLCDVIGVHRQHHLHRRFAVLHQLLRGRVVGVVGLEVRLQGFQLVAALLPGGGVAARELRRHHDEMAGVEIGRGNLALQFGLPQIVPGLELEAGRQHVGAIADGVDIGPGADVIGADLGLLDQRLGIRNLAQIERLIEAVGGVEPADMRRGEGEIAFGIALGELGLVQAVDGAAGDEFDVGAGLLP